VKSKKRNRHKKPISSGWIKDNIFVYTLLLVIIPSVLYFRVVNFGFSGLDDGSIIRNVNGMHGNLLNLKEAFTHDAFMGEKGDTFYRPIQVISFMIDSQIGGNEPWIYHLSNLILHILTVIALFFFLIKTGIKKEISFLLALIFSINPLFTNAVAWIPARGDILLCLFGLLSFITFLEYFRTRRIIDLVSHSIVFFLAIFSKETAVLIPVLILSYLYFVQRKTFILKDIFPEITVWIFTFALFFSLRHSVINVSHSSNIFGFIPFVKNLPAIPITFFKFFIPYSLCTMPFFDNIGIIGGIILLIIFTGVTFKFIPGGWRIILWGGVWFIVFTIPPMFFRSYYAFTGYEYFEYRAYLPIVGILLIIGILASELLKTIPLRKLIIYSIPILIIYTIMAFNHSSDFANPFSFFTSAINHNSNNAMAFGERGTAYYGRGDKERALSDYDNSIKACPTYPHPYFNKGVYYNAINDHFKSEYFFSQALKFDTVNKESHVLDSKVYLNLSFEKNALRKYNENKALLKRATMIYPDDSKLHFNLGLTYYSAAKFDSALFEFNKAIEFEKNNFTYYDNRGMTKYHLNDNYGALNDFNRVLELNPDYPDTWGSRGMVKAKLNDNYGAVSDLTIAIGFNPRVGVAYYYRGISYLKLNKLNEARVDFEKAKQLGYKGSAENKINYKP
jgi:protein O-mannosyl-transferase